VLKLTGCLEDGVGSAQVGLLRQQRLVVRVNLFGDELDAGSIDSE
jgi:hypothetical protein